MTAIKLPMLTGKYDKSPNTSVRVRLCRLEFGKVNELQSGPRASKPPSRSRSTNETAALKPVMMVISSHPSPGTSETPGTLCKSNPQVTRLYKTGVNPQQSYGNAYGGEARQTFTVE